MKSSALITLLFFITTAFSANITPEVETLECRKYVKALDLHFTASLLVEQDLINGIWTTQTEPGLKKVFQFTEYGLADILTIDPKGSAAYRNALWRVEESRGQIFLVLTESDMHEEKYFNVRQNCEGVILANMTECEEMVLTYKPLTHAVKFNKTRANLIGEWTNITYPSGHEEGLKNCSASEDMKGAFLRYTFNQDGTYACVYGNNKIKVEEKGMWDVSKDGNYVIFHVADNCDPERITESKVVVLKQVDEHSMVLEHPLVTRDFTKFFCTELETFSFVK